MHPKLPSTTAHSLLALVLLLPAGLAHEDDPKILDTEPVYTGPGWRPAAAPGRSLAIGESYRAGTASPAVNFPAQGIRLLSWLTLSELIPGGGNDCWGYTSPSGREYALACTGGGTAFVDITHPGAPVVVARIPGPSSLWRDVKIYQDHAYIVTEGTGGGIQVVDLSGIDAGVVTLVNTVTTGGTGSTHNVAIDTTSGFLYRTGGGQHGLRIYDLADKANPVFVRDWSTRYVHDAQVVTYTEGPYDGRQIAFLCSGFNGGSGQTRFEILDVTNKNNIFVRGTVFYSNRQYSHQVWTNEDHSLAFLNDELDENGALPTTTYVFDISNLDNPQQISSFTNGNSAIGHNLYAAGDLCYEANYRSGMRVFDVSDPQQAQETAWFDTWPQDDRNAFNGLWSCYPFFESGAVIGMDREKGLFVWWVGDPKVGFEVVGGVPAILDPAGESLTVQISEREAGDLVVGSERLHVQVDGDFVEIPLVSLGSGQYRADFPAAAAGTSTSGICRRKRATAGVGPNPRPRRERPTARAPASLRLCLTRMTSRRIRAGLRIPWMTPIAASGNAACPARRERRGLLRKITVIPAPSAG